MHEDVRQPLNIICDIFKNNHFIDSVDYCKMSWIIDDVDNEIIDDEVELPREFSLEQNYPNPFNGETNICFYTTESGVYNFKMYNVLGRIVHKEIIKIQQPGEFTIKLDNSILGDLASGIYFYNVSYSTFSKTKKMMYLK